MIEILIDAMLDSLKLIPFLFVSFIIMELIEHKFNNKKKLAKINKFGPLAGATLGIIPQCGFSALASNLYAARVITLGTLFSIYLSTSDEMLPILISSKVSSKIIFEILLIKFLLGLIFGMLVDLVYKRKQSTKEIEKFCQHENCHCEDSVIKSSIIHTMKITFFILIINIFLNSIIDKSIIATFTQNNKIMSPIITSVIGLIPNCASSVIITQLYIEKVISFGSCISGLLAGSGVGGLILFKQNKRLKENILIVLTLIIFSSFCGIIFNLLDI